MVAAGAATGGQTGMAAVIGRRKQPKSQQLQPVAAAANITTADRTNSFLMFLTIAFSEYRIEARTVGANCSVNLIVQLAGKRNHAQNLDQTIRRSGGGLSNSTPPSVLCKRHACFFGNKAVANTPLAAPKMIGA